MEEKAKKSSESSTGDEDVGKVARWVTRTCRNCSLFLFLLQSPFFFISWDSSVEKVEQSFLVGLLREYCLTPYHTCSLKVVTPAPLDMSGVGSCGIHLLSDMSFYYHALNVSL